MQRKSSTVQLRSHVAGSPFGGDNYVLARTSVMEQLPVGDRQLMDNFRSTAMREMGSRGPWRPESTMLVALETCSRT